MLKAPLPMNTMSPYQGLSSKSSLVISTLRSHGNLAMRTLVQRVLMQELPKAILQFLLSRPDRLLLNHQDLPGKPLHLSKRLSASNSQGSDPTSGGGALPRLLAQRLVVGPTVAHGRHPALSRRRRRETEAARMVMGRRSAGWSP